MALCWRAVEVVRAPPPSSLRRQTNERRRAEANDRDNYKQRRKPATRRLPRCCCCCFDDCYLCFDSLLPLPLPVLLVHCIQRPLLAASTTAQETRERPTSPPLSFHEHGERPRRRHARGYYGRPTSTSLAASGPMDDQHDGQQSHDGRSGQFLSRRTD
jgi:hypothetical protein